MSFLILNLDYYEPLLKEQLLLIVSPLQPLSPHLVRQLEHFSNLTQLFELFELSLLLLKYTVFDDYEKLTQSLHQIILSHVGLNEDDPL